MLAKRALSIVGGLAVIGWPFAVWLVISYPELHILLPILALCFVLRLCTLRGKTGALSRAFKGLAIAGAVLSVASIWMREAQLLLWYPVVVNGVMLALFGSSLFSSMSIVERLARLCEGNLPPAGVRYTRRVTQVWCVFFIINGSVSLFTCLAGNVHWWTLWNGMISYLLMGLLFACEWLIRIRVKRRYE